MNKTLEYYMSLPYRVEIVKDLDEGGFALCCPELPGCITCSETTEDGMKMLEDAKRAWLQACLDDGLTIPEPTRIEDFSGQIRLRMPKSLHKRLAEQSAREGISMNQYCIHLLSKGV